MTPRRVTGTNENDPSRACRLDAQLVTRTQAGLAKRIDRNRRLILLTDARAATHP